jgi:hypothetical protein
MKKRLIILIILLLLAIGAYWTASHYVVSSEWGLMVLNKRFLTFHDSYVNAKAWGYSDYEEHPNIMAAMRQQGYEDILDDMRVKERKQTVQRALQEQQEKLEEFRSTVESEIESWKQSVMDIIPEEWRKPTPTQQPTPTNTTSKAGAGERN